MTDKPDTDGLALHSDEPLTLMPWMTQTLGPDLTAEFMQRVRVEMRMRATSDDAPDARELQIAAEYAVRATCVDERSKLSDILGCLATYARVHFEEDEDD